MERYLAFISYRHQSRDQRVSELLRRGLESWHLPEGCGLPKKRRVFRDTDELPTSSDLGKDIERALEDSGWLVALCSEDYPASKWCMRELDEYLNSGRKDRILPVLVSGDPEKAVPPQIRDLPAAMDLRGAGTHALPGRVRAQLPGLLARMTGTDSHRFADSERRHRILAGGAAVAAAAAAILGFSFYAMRTADRIARNNEELAAATVLVREAEGQALAERDNALEKEAKYYAEQSWKAIAAEDDTRAVALALQGLP